MLSEVRPSLCLVGCSIDPHYSGWDGLTLASDAPSDRPAFGGTCYTNIYNVPISVSFYDNSALKATSIFTATESPAQAFAYPYEGFALGVAVVPPTSGTGSSSQPTATSSSSAAAVYKSDRLSGSAVAGIVLAAIASVVMILATAFFILRHRRNSLQASKEIEREFQYGGSPTNRDPNAPNAGYYNSDLKKYIPAPEELYGSQDVKNHGETQELDSGRGVYELGDGREMPSPSRPLSYRDKKLPDLPSPLHPSPVSPLYP